MSSRFQICGWGCLLSETVWSIVIGIADPGCPGHPTCEMFHKLASPRSPLWRLGCAGVLQLATVVCPLWSVGADAFGIVSPADSQCQTMTTPVLGTCPDCQAGVSLGRRRGRIWPGVLALVLQELSRVTAHGKGRSTLPPRPVMEQDRRCETAKQTVFSDREG
jgi:hypothetical protein